LNGCIKKTDTARNEKGNIQLACIKKFYLLVVLLETVFIHCVQASTFLPSSLTDFCKFGYFLFWGVGL
ncbi:MAG: hypothetical protein COT89_02545, partial [Candidatus Colwellbacteria bacterium CG10_big_fil_rev_8_21_14_0_10_42_22]